MMNLGLMDPAFLGSLGSERDPYFSNVSLLLHGNGTNGSTSIIDSSPSAKTVTALDNAQITTTRSKFGGSSINAGSGGVSIANSSDTTIGTRDFTIELFFYLPDLNYKGIFDQRPSTASSAHPTIYTVSGNVSYFVLNSNRITGGPLVTNSFNYLKVYRINGTTKMNINGTVQAQTYADSNNYGAPTNGTLIGAIIDQALVAEFDEFRMTVGVGRDSVEVPTAPFPDA